MRVILVMEISNKVKALHHDSRKVTPGSMFFCLDGTRVRGAKYAKDAVKRGAVCIVTEKKLEHVFARSICGAKRTKQSQPETILVPDVRAAMSFYAKKFYRSRADEIRIIGVVGTNGKTTTAHIMKHILETAGERVGILGTLHGDLTTPDPIDLHRVFEEMFDTGIRTVVMEVSAHAIHFKKLAGITFAAVIFTNISQDHLDFFGSFENYCNTKINFFLAKGGDIKTAVINTDNEFGRRIFTEREGNSVEYCLQDVQLFPDKSVISVPLLEKGVARRSRDGVCDKFEVNLPARFNAQNALGCITCARVLGVKDDTIKNALKTIPRISGRFNVYKIGKDGAVTAIIDFAHTPDGLEKIISAVREFAPARVITVFGCGGNRDRKKRPIMGEISARLSDFTVITSDNPRFEKPLFIMKQIKKGFQSHKNKLSNNKNFAMIENRAEAITFAINFANPGDIVIIAGKGGETHTEIRGQMIEYTDEFVITTHNTINSPLERRGGTP